MSQENMEIARRCFDAWNRDDLDAFLAEIDPAVVWHTAIEGSAEGDDMVYRGHNGVRQVWKDYRGDVFSRIELWDTELIDLGASVLRLGRLRVTGRASGVEIESEFAQHVLMRDGLIVSSRDYLSHAEALEAAGLSE
jgi:ketosteroid isomerase-like protein